MNIWMTLIKKHDSCSHLLASNDRNEEQRELRRVLTSKICLKISGKIRYKCVLFDSVDHLYSWIRHEIRPTSPVFNMCNLWLRRATAADVNAADRNESIPMMRGRTRVRPCESWYASDGRKMTTEIVQNYDSGTRSAEQNVQTCVRCGLSDLVERWRRKFGVGRMECHGRQPVAVAHTEGHENEHWW